MTLDEYFAGQDEARRLFESPCRVIDTFDEVDIRVTKSQVAFYRHRAFAWAWIPGKYVRGRVAPLVLTLALPFRDASTRWKEIVEPRPGRLVHHLELRDPGEVDEEVSEWARIAWTEAA